MITIAPHSSPDTLFADAAAWNHLSGGVPFRQTSWLESWWNTVGQSRDLMILVARDDQQVLKGVFPLCRGKAPIEGLTKSRSWQTMAGGNVCTDHVSILCPPQDIDSVAGAFAKFLVDHADAPQWGWNRLSLDGVVAGDPGMKSLLQHLETLQAKISLSSRMSLWFKPTAENWEDFLSKNSRKLRQRLRTMHRRLGEHSDVLRVEIASDRDAVESSLSQLIDLHQQRWNAVGEPGTYASDEMVAFIQQATQAFHANEQLFLPTLVHRDPVSGEQRVIAAELHLIGSDQRMYCYSTGVDYEFADFTPGAMLNAFVLKYAHEQGMRGVDYLRGDEEYKGRLHANASPLLCANVFAPTMMGRVTRAIASITEGCKQRLRERLKRPPVKEFTRAEAFDDQWAAWLPTPLVPVQHEPLTGQSKSVVLSDLLAPPLAVGSCTDESTV